MSEALIAFPLIPGTKNPAVPWSEVLPGQYAAVGNYAVKLTAEILVLDFDAYKETGAKSLETFFSRYPNLRTRIVQTPRGGYHVYLRKPPNQKYKQKNQKNWPGVDFQSDGQYVVGPGTSTSEGKDRAAGTYTLLGNAPIAEAPADFLAELELVTDKVITDGAPVSRTMYEDFRLTCQTYDPAVQGQNGDQETFKLACLGFDMALEIEDVFQLMRDDWNPRCQPPWNEGELYDKVRNARKYRGNAIGNKAPEAIFTPTVATAPAVNVVSIDDRRDEQIMKAIKPAMLQVDEKGNPIDSLHNIACLLKVDHAWRGRIRYNQFASTLEFVDRPPWRRNQLNVGLAIEKRDIACIQVWFSDKRMEVPETKLIAALEAVAEPVHPVKNYLESLVWDEVPRLDKILIDTAGADDDPLNRDIGRCILIGAIRRIYEPGSKHDDVPILEGPQGTRKSMWIQVLGGEWSSTGQLVRGDKDTYQNLRGRWIVELPEINATFSKADANWLKGIISTSVDTYRASYAKTASQVPRESVFIGTINPSASKEYLKDDENRRYLPVTTRQLDIERLKRDRDQYFAEALHRYKAGEPAWIVDPLIRAMAKRRQEERREKDPLVEVLSESDWLYAPNGVTPLEIYRGLGYTAANVASHHRRRIYAALKELGFTFEASPTTGGRWMKTNLTWRDVI